MASSKNKLTEEQLSEGLFSSIMKNILKGRTKKVLNVIQNDPILKKAADFEASSKRLKKATEKAAKAHKSAWKNSPALR